MQARCIDNDTGTADRIQLEYIILVSAAIRNRNGSDEYGGFR
jgi:hypothetical protein